MAPASKQRSRGSHATELADRTAEDHPAISCGARQPAHRAQCQYTTREKVRLLVQLRQPAQFPIDHDTLNTPIHRMLESPKHLAQPDLAADSLRRLLADLASAEYLNSYINFPNRCGRTPLSICLRADQYAGLISVLVAHGAQLHHLCGALAEHCNHLHYAMSKATPQTIDRTLNEVFLHPSGSDGMYAQNRWGETPKGTLMKRLEAAAWREPELQQQLACILDRIPAYPPYSGPFVPPELPRFLVFDVAKGCGVA